MGISTIYILSLWFITTFYTINYISNESILHHKEKEHCPCGAANTQRCGSFLDGGISIMTTVESVIKAFRESRIAGEKKLSRGEITWDEYAFVMLGFEARLRSMVVQL